MLRMVFASLALAVAALPAAAQDAPVVRGQWSVDYNDEGDLCFMEQSFDTTEGATSGIVIGLPWDADAELVLRNSSWSMTEGTAPAELWFTADWERAADTTVTARYHKPDGTTHIDITLSDDQLKRLGTSEAIVVRVSGGGPFERYPIGPTQAALDEMGDCYDYYDY
jgi:hypothetical protein